ncbi:MAG: hypothetical protein IJ710_10480 [Prevotella sp.]|nr:hypothetical protein [Prevotella sp.]
MKLQTKRHISSILLLAVFVPMLIGSSLHLHRAEASVADSCTECVHHTPHAGHFGTSTPTIHACVLCQFLQYDYLAAPLLLAAASVALSTICPATRSRRNVGRTYDSHPLRAPPAFH